MSTVRRGTLRRCAVLLLAGWWTCAQGQQPGPGGVEVRASIEPRETSIVDPVLLTVEAIVPAGTRVEELSPPLEEGASLGGLTIAAVRREPARLHEDGERLLLRWVVTLEPYLPGEASIPPIGVSVTRADGQTLRGMAEQMVVNVRPVLPEGEEFQAGSIRPPPEPPVVAGTGSGIGLWAALAGGMACVGLGAAGALALRPTSARVVRRAFARLERRARDAAKTGNTTERAHGVLGVVREALAIVVGHRARSATPSELGLLLGGVQGVASEEARLAAAWATWLEQREYAGPHAPPTPGAPPELDPVPMLAALRQAAVRSAMVHGARPPSREGRGP